MNQGFKLPPHLSVLSEAASIRETIEVIENLAVLTCKTRSHISRQHTQSRQTGTTIFIGHGHSRVWLELKDFLTDRLHLQVDEFNRVPVAGTTTIDRLKQMLDMAFFAFLIMTGEDEQPDGKVHARLNVVHEAGLFQGRLGFKRAIIMCEERCEGFSNIDGLSQIRFPKG